MLHTIPVTRNYHQCTLKTGSESALPGLPVHSANIVKWWRKLKKHMILNESDDRCREVFRSHFAVMTERTRHANLKHCFIIHPFSLFAERRAHLLCLLWMINMLIEPYSAVFHHTSDMTLVINVVQLIDVLFFVNIILEFLIGYYVPITKEIVLAPKRIMIRYLSTYFLFDLVGCFPFYFVWGLTRKPGEEVSHLCVIKLIRLCRLKSMYTYMTGLFLKFKLGKSTIKWLKIFIMALYFMHWWACVFYGFSYIWYGTRNIPSNSWLHNLTMIDEKKITRPYIYFMSFLTASSHFYGASDGEQRILLLCEQVVASFCLITGYAYCTYFTAIFLQIFGATEVAESKYEELVYQLAEYSRAKKLPHTLHKRLLTYYRYKYNKKFFNEGLILNTLSDHLRYEILLFNCRNIIEKVIALQGLSKIVVGGLIANFKHEVYLQNDVIIKKGDPPLKIYFIAHGTVSVYWSSGQEITHHEDGDFFGTIKGDNIVSITAAENTETFSMDLSDLKYIFKIDKGVAERLNNLQTAKRDEYLNLVHFIEDLDRESVIMNLRRGQILEKRHFR